MAWGGVLMRKNIVGSTVGLVSCVWGALCALRWLCTRPPPARVHAAALHIAYWDIANGVLKSVGRRQKPETLCERPGRGRVQLFSTGVGGETGLLLDLVFRTRFLCARGDMQLGGKPAANWCAR